MKTKAEIIKETVNFYNQNNRGTKFDGGIGGCVYYNPDTEAMCAVGRCLEYPKKAADFVGGVEYSFGEVLDKELKPEYRGHEIEFWRDLQNLHDGGYNWNNDGLSINGEAEARELMGRWGDK